ncbi:sugar ABC transporter substrate-binding protein [Paenibacillus sp.]|uniref:ABC transporter substrate-binding protein n=1 Tax=Paenibacillus sp. TaxID=58172 RepID=UPI002D71BEB9|nr:sugar ABC transporter substrate-binding protein [Paenibacillus sp.]HZG83376.1 sugar ABC transporter substrate-binding protein [Paenibacillus sp.]
MLNRKTLSLATVLGATAVFAGCSESGTTPDEATALTFWTFHEAHAGFFELMAERWNEAHPDEPINLTTTTHPYEEQHNKLLISLQSGVGAPDLSDIEISKFPNFLKGEQLQIEDLTPMVEPVRDKFVEARFDIYSKGDKVYGLPYHVGATVVYYNMDIMNQAGVNPDDIRSWNDYVEAGKKVAAATGVPMTSVETTDQWSFWPLISQQGSDYFDADGNLILDNDTNIKTLEFLYNMVHRDKIAVIAPGGFHHSEEFYGFMNQGGIASITMPMWYGARIAENMPDLKGKIAIRPMPYWEEGGNRSAGMGGTATVVTNQTKHLDLTKRFLEFAKLSEEGAIEIWNSIGYDPARWDVWDSEKMNASNKLTDFYGNGIFDTLSEIKDEINPVHMTETLPLVSDAVKKNVMFRVLEEQSQTPAEALKAAADEIRSQQ